MTTRSMNGKVELNADLRALAETLAQKHAASPEPSARTPTPLDALERWQRQLRQAYRHFVQRSEAKKTLSGAGEWLLDNFYVVQTAVRQVEKNLPTGYYHRLPRLTESELAGYPRVYAIARALVRHFDGHLDLDQIVAFLRVYQETRPLSMGELWALPTVLRLVLIELLAQTAMSLIDLEAASNPAWSFSVTLSGDVAEEVIVAHCIHSLRAIEARDWDAYFEAVSCVEAALRDDPAGIYAEMDFETRDRYRKVIEQLARDSEQDEQMITQEVLDLAGDDSQAGERERHVGYYLVGGGRARLEQRLDYHPPWTTRLHRWVIGHPTWVYLGGIFGLTALLLAAFVALTGALGGTVMHQLLAVTLALIPTVTVVVNLVNSAVTGALPPRQLPKMDFREKIPADCTTMVVVPALISGEDEVDFLLHQIEQHYLSHSDSHVRYALLTDFSDAQAEHRPEDKALLNKARHGIKGLNRTYAQGDETLFYLFHRRRLWNPAEEAWMGWERKRGKLAEFNRLVLGASLEETSYVETVGDLDFFSEVRFVITLDADTVLSRGATHRMIATLAHPLNRARFDEETGEVVAGYTVLQPRTEVRPTAVNRSRFTRIFAGDMGLDLYTCAVSDVYQDLFGEGIYVGKGIYDVAAFERSLRQRVPESALLSHDLFEGVHGRAALVTDIVLYEDYPPTYLAHARRLHRWVRGDWQLLPWLGPRVPKEGGGTLPNRLSLIDRWRIVDNLRRSLRAPALLAFLIGSWLVLPGSAWIWTLLILVLSATPVLRGALTAFVRRLRAGEPTVQTLSLWTEAARWLCSLIFLPYEALLMVDAIGTTLVRLFISHKRLLQWATAAHTVRIFGRKSRIRTLWPRMRGASLLAAVLILALLLFAPNALWVAAPLLLMWLVSPFVALWLDEAPGRVEVPLTVGQQQDLRCLARRTWFFFEQFVGPDDHWLPPDHFQEQPRGLVAHRTSPTNIGMLLLSTLAAYELGYVDLLNLMVRLRSTFDSLDQLERYRGHFLNWYETRNLTPLDPRYVSTVDSGNLAAALWTLAQGLQRVTTLPVLHWQRWQGLADALNILSEIIAPLKSGSLQEPVTALGESLATFRQRIDAVEGAPAQRYTTLIELSGAEGEALVDQLTVLLETAHEHLEARTLRDLRHWVGRVHHHLGNMRQEMEMLLPWFLHLCRPPDYLTDALADAELADAWIALNEALPPAPALADLPALCRDAAKKVEALQSLLPTDAADLDDEELEQVEEAQRWCERLQESLRDGRMAAQSVLIGLDDLSAQAERYVRDMKFGFLYDERRQIFRIGYNVSDERLDPNHYDLLASEARTASLVAIAKGEVRSQHWLHLSRPLTRVDGHRVLLSWNGSMFEYLMPNLMLRDYDQTLLAQTNRGVVERQIRYAREHDVPWGVSESGYYRFDANMNYQYRGFGVPGLGRKQGLGEDLVITPYASLLALSTAPQAVWRNVQRLCREEVMGAYGLYEAVDYTATRLPLGEERAIVRSYMAHHQGMILLALTNYLRDAVLVDDLHGDPRIQTVELLLQEQVPERAALEETAEITGREERAESERVRLRPWMPPPDAPLPMAHVLSNGRYGTLITTAGSGYSTYTREGETIALTRWRADTSLDDWGTWIYVRDEESGALWSATRQPTRRQPQEAEVKVYPHHVAFSRLDDEIYLKTDVTVAPEDDVEIRRVTVTNRSGRTRRLTLTSYGEIVLAPQDADRGHPAFNKMFVESEYLSEHNALLFRRRPRSSEDAPWYLAHALVVQGRREETAAYETDRARFLGRGQTVRAPQALTGERAGLSGTTGATLDPIIALGQTVTLAPHRSAKLAYVTVAATSREAAVETVAQYRSWSRLERAFDQAASNSQVELSKMGLDVDDLDRFQQLLSALVYPHPALRALPETLAENALDQSGLWPHAISGDYPILLVRVSQEEDLALVRQVLQAHRYWRHRHVKIDLVILNEKNVGYAEDLQDRLGQLLHQTDNDAWRNRRGGIFVLQAGRLDEATRTLLKTVARVILNAGAGSLAHQLKPLAQSPTPLPALTPVKTTAAEEEALPPPSRPGDLQFDNGYGGFTPDGREYVINVTPDQWTPAPWINVIANEHGGFLVSEAGSGYSWAVNSGENRLTPWRNDPVADPPGEALYLRDEETGAVWSPTPLPAGEERPYLVRHGAGYSTFAHHSHGLRQRLRLFMAPEAPVKIVQLRLENAWSHTRRLTVTFYAPWVLGKHRDQEQLSIVSDYDGGHHALLARNTYSMEFSERVAFVAADREPHGVTTNRTEFLGREGDPAHPAALDRVGLSDTVGAGHDPCAAIQVHVDLPPGESKEIVFLLGQGGDAEEARALMDRFQADGAIEAAWEERRTFWGSLLETVQVETPDPAMDLLLNGWLLYQALACRLWGRSALYQSGGAYGFRDQLQDVMALLHARPALAREHILRAARHQFEVGDVLHWWHPPSGRGVRTRISDDLLWLPYVTAEYVAATGDVAILDEVVPFRAGEPLAEDEEERYGHYELTNETASLYEHCCRALERGTTSGPRGLPLMGSGDWNDGMNRVGMEGRGESVWLGWFLVTALQRLADLSERRDDAKRAELFRAQAETLLEALETQGWDGDWYRRAYYDDGTPLGSAQNRECQIDSLPQSWAVISGAGRLEHVEEALAAVDERLVREDDGLLLLFTPPFEKAPHDPGYIKGYPPGIRENGGQYTHGALWVVWANALLGRGDRAEALFRLLNPIHHSETPEQAQRYAVEPYVVAADVYSAPEHLGRGGWTWYTGSSGWMYRAGLEAILGVKREGDRLRIAPSIPEDWETYTVRYRYGEALYVIRVENPDGVNGGVRQVMVDEEEQPERSIPLVNDGAQHDVRVILRASDT